MTDHGHHWFEPIAEHLGAAYLRYSFTKGTEQEVDALIEWMNLEPGMRILDVGCGPGRHSYALASRGFDVTGIDISGTFIDLARAGAPPGAEFHRMDARTMPFRSEFDAVICLCQGAFGLMTAHGDDERVLAGMARALRPSGRLALSAFSAYFAVRYHEGADFDADTGVSHEVTEVRNPAGQARMTDLWTGCYTPRELRLMCARAGLTVAELWSVEPGAYRRTRPSLESPEYLLIAFPEPS